MTLNARTGLALAALALASACAHEKPSEPTADKPMGARMDEARKGVAGAALTPLEDVGLVRPDIPPALASITYPYGVASLGGSCAQVAYELGALDVALGAESYAPKAKENMSQRGVDAAAGAVVDAAEGAADSVVPFRGWIRKASGADRAARKAARAVEMGQTRRAFLRGYGAALGCPNMLPPGPDAKQASAKP